MIPNDSVIVTVYSPVTRNLSILVWLEHQVAWFCVMLRNIDGTYILVKLRTGSFCLHPKKTIYLQMLIGLSSNLVLLTTSVLFFTTNKDNSEKADSKPRNIDFLSANWDGEATLVDPSRDINTDVSCVKNIV